MFVRPTTTLTLFAEAEQTIARLQEKRRKLQSRRVVNQADLVESLGKGVILPEELTEEEHIAIFGLNLADSKAEEAAWDVLRAEVGGTDGNTSRQRIVEWRSELQGAL